MKSWWGALDNFSNEVVDDLGATARQFHQRGAEHVYNIQNLVGGACYEPVDSGLTRFGQTIVQEMNRVGMLVDLSHVGNRTSLDAIAASAALTHFCRMVASLCETIGVEHVGLGSDCTREWGNDYVAYLRDGRWRAPDDSAPPSWPAWPEWFQGPADLPRVTDGLVDVGLNEEEIVAILGVNWLDLFDRVFPEGAAR